VIENPSEPPAEQPQPSPLNKPLPPLPKEGGSIYLSTHIGCADLDFVPRRRAPAPPADGLPSPMVDEQPFGSVNKLKGVFEK